MKAKAHPLWLSLKSVLPLLLIGCLFSCRSVPAPSGTVSPQPNQARPITRLADAPYPVGVALSPNKLRNREPYRQLVEREFSSITAENVMKLHHLQPRQGEYNWADADFLVQFAREHGMQVHGHTLLWHESAPQWLKDFKGDSAAWEKLLQGHIRTVLTHFKGKVRSWDVVNEAVLEDGSLRKSLWYEHLGPDYVARAFQYAREADPQALLFYNDYGIEDNNAKLARVLQLVDGLKARGIPIDGVGLQMHINIHRPSDEGIRYALQQLRERNLLVHISELDISVNPEAKDLPLTGVLLQQQKEKYRTVVEAFGELPRRQQYAVTLWGVADADSWIRSYFKRKDWPLLFDDNYQPKPAFEGFLEGLR